MWQDAADKSARQAWDGVLSAIRKYGAYYSVEFDDPAVSVTIAKLGGWIGLCGRSSVDLHSDLAVRFRRVYQSLAAAECEPVPLRGIIERDNPYGRLSTIRVSVSGRQYSGSHYDQKSAGCGG